MNPTSPYTIAVGVVLGIALIPIVIALFRAFFVEVDDEEVVLVTRFGKLVSTLKRPGLHSLPGRILPWVKTIPVSLRRDFRTFTNVHVNDARGTTVIIDLWLEFRIADPEKAIFLVSEWDRSLQNLVAHTATSILGNREFRQILCDRMELGEVVRHEIEAETSRWGLKIELLFISKVSLLPEVSRQIFDSVAARLERAKADIEESGRLAIAQLEADTSVKVAALVAEAKGQYPTAVGRAFQSLGPVLPAYMELYDLSQVRPHRTVSFRGFSPGELKAAEAQMMLMPPSGPNGDLPKGRGGSAKGRGDPSSSD